jgi:hypothetical protein
LSDLWLGIAVLVEQRGASELDATILRPRREDEPGRGLHLASIRQRIESIFWTCKDILTLDRYGARTFAGLRERPSNAYSASSPPYTELPPRPAKPRVRQLLRQSA